MAVRPPFLLALHLVNHRTSVSLCISATEQQLICERQNTVRGPAAGNLTDRRTSVSLRINATAWDMEVLRLRKCAKRKGGLRVMESSGNFLYTTYTWTVIDFFLGGPWVRFVLQWMESIEKAKFYHLSVWAGAALYFSKLRLRWSVITVGNRPTIDMYFIVLSQYKNYDFSAIPA